MSKTRRKRTSSEEQYRLLMECRTSGLSDQQWCRKKGIEPSTFYNWVSRLRKRGIPDVPEPCRAGEFAPTPIQDVVKLELFQERNYEIAMTHPVQSQLSPTIEISLGNAIIRVSNDADPQILSLVMNCLGGSSC